MENVISPNNFYIRLIFFAKYGYCSFVLLSVFVSCFITFTFFPIKLLLVT